MTYFEQEKIENIAEITIAGVSNRNFGGWGAIIVENGIKRELIGGSIYTTINQMELIACSQALKSLSQKSIVNININSLYIIDGITKWIAGWKKNKWLTKSGEPVKNKSFWLDLEKACQYHKINWHLIFSCPNAEKLANSGKEAEKLKMRKNGNNNINNRDNLVESAKTH